MLNSAALSTLADLPPTTCQRACRLLADYDLTRPRLLVLLQLDRRYAWPEGTSETLVRLLASSRAGLIEAKFRTRPRYPARAVVRIAPEWLLPPRTAALRQQELRQAQDRDLAIQAQATRPQ